MTTGNDSHVLMRAFAQELGRCGIAGAVTSPGSRSTPLLLALGRDGDFPVFSQVDERSAGFFALGLAKATGRPAILACTSGTAAANYLPAVIEAREARVPLVVCTADRPPELRDVGAGQAIDQVKLYGDAVSMFVEVGVDRADAPTTRWLRELACRAVWTSLGPRPGPVHLNFPFREPLVPEGELPPETEETAGRPDGRPWTARVSVPPSGERAAEVISPVVTTAAQGVVVAGRIEDEDRERLARAAQAFSQASGWPVLADALSGLRTGEGAIAHYDALLGCEAFAAAARPAAVLRIGDLPTSKPLRAWLGGLDAVSVLLDPHGAWQDPGAAADLVVVAPPAATLAALGAAGGHGAGDWLGGWRTADDRAAAAIEGALGDALTEPRIALELGRLLPDEATLLVASSLPVRDVENFFPRRPDPPAILSNRGANGIDGTIATAYGLSAGSQEPVVLLIGDVAFAHDVGSLLCARRLGAPLTIVLVDNGGGAIFDALAISGESDLYEQHVLTPTGLDIPGIAQAFGLHLLEPQGVEELRAAVSHGLESSGTQLVHVRTDRAAGFEARAAARQAVAAALSA
ncbi:MAG: 2-succinyl-5-enolpyruvyl-6-hydroxy-3-cyclohexene-1-carboxylic-acid synthase [Solirubrobacterales bacterium]